ncbi:MAG TPA: APC family permease [Candidatus Omnitrophota bacterium]|nr:APC family permease [Candidatus Omnitrophota bacterium]HPD85484.1 APC family permease [Candidatus Omnitrophota bacterium]HRZ04015.1 APC family permease [Candidatus Omnitrophota bacterium]
MENKPKTSLAKRIKTAVIGQARSPLDRHVFHSLSLVAFFAWVGLGADGLSSSCYGPEEAFLALGNYHYLSIFVALGTVLTIFLISASYSQIIELFPAGGGGYLVASKLLSPGVGMVSGCALLIDYVFTIAISIASGSDALFSFLPVEWQPYKIYLAVFGVFLLTLMNIRGVRESVIPLIPIFLIFVGTHLFAIVYGIFVHAGNFPHVWNSTASDIHLAGTNLGLFGMIFLILRAYSMGAGTFTGIEAVSNGLPILRDPKVETGKKTMRYMSISLAVTVLGLMITYLLFDVNREAGKTLNAVLMENIVLGWPNPYGYFFILVTLISEAMILFVAAQAGFLDGPRVLANMASDRWFPTKFSSLSDRLVTQNGLLLMGLAALMAIVFTHGSVHILVVLYSINVFITFCLSQLGMVRHWWNVRESVRTWKKKIAVNGLGLTLTSFILISIIIIKFNQGGWITLLITGALVVFAIMVKRHYRETAKLLNRLDSLVQTASSVGSVDSSVKTACAFDPGAKTAVLLVNGFNGLGLHTLFNVIRFFGKEFKNFVFLEIGVIDAGNFKGAQEVDRLKLQSEKDIERYVSFMNHSGYYAQGCCAIGIDVIEEIEKVCAQTLEHFPGAVFFGGQLVFPQETVWNRWLHNYTVFAIQRKLYQKGIPFVILPIRVY